MVHKIARQTSKNAAVALQLRSSRLTRMRKTPEERAAFWQRLENMSGTIRDPETRNQYRAEWRRKFEETYPGASATLHRDGRSEAITASPFVWREASQIPPRPWVYGKALLRNTVTAVLAPGGVGKSAFMVGVTLSLATGKPLLGKHVHDGPKKVWYWNLEDDGDELARQIVAASISHRISPEQCGDRLFVDSGLDGAELCTATDETGDFKIVMPVIDAIIEQLTSNQIDVLIIDPFVSSHQVDENANSKIDRVVKQWARVAREANCAIALVHHTRKLGGEKVSAEHSRGASALVNAARSALVLNRMDDDEAERFGIDDKAEQRRYFSVRDDKANRAPPELQDWYRIGSVALANGDDVGAVQPWTPPDVFSGITTEHLYRCQLAIDQDEWRESAQATKWAGHAIAPVLGFNLDDKKDRTKASQIIRTWLQNGALKTVKRADAKRMERAFIEVGDWAIIEPATPEKSQVRQGVASEANGVPHSAAPPPSPPYRGERGGAGATPQKLSGVASDTGLDS